jgi:regulatory protein
MSIEKIQRSALALLTRRDHTKLELAQKLARKGYAAEDISTVLDRLEESGLINTNRYIQNFITYRRSRGYGPRRIAMELHTKGAPEALIDEYLNIHDNSWLTEIHNVWQKQFKGRTPADHQTRAKQMRFLFNRGFTQEQIKAVMQGTNED